MFNSSGTEFNLTRLDSTWFTFWFSIYPKNHCRPKVKRTTAAHKFHKLFKYLMAFEKQLVALINHEKFKNKTYLWEKRDGGGHENDSWGQSEETDRHKVTLNAPSCWKTRRPLSTTDELNPKTGISVAVGFCACPFSTE